MTLSTTARRRLVATAATAALAVALTACGGDAGSDAPTDASVDDFCSTYFEVLEVGSEDDAEDWVDRMSEVGTPSDMSDDARGAFESLLDAAGEGETGDLETAGALTEYITTNCADALPDSLGDIEIPDLPTP